MVGVRPGKNGGHQEGIGKRLSATRETKGLSLEEVSHQLHIPLAQLKGLEAEDFSVFSAELYARGAYRAYAMYLGIYSTTASREFYRTLTHVRQRVPLKLHTPESFLESLINPRTIFIGSCIAIALLVGGYIAWQVQSFWRLPHLAIEGGLSRSVPDGNTIITGQTEQLARLTVNGEPVLLTPDAHFSVSLSLRPGINLVRIEATNAAGRVKAERLFLLRES